MSKPAPNPFEERLPTASFLTQHNEAQALVAQMTLTEKASLCSGKNFWFLQGVERLGVESVMVTDGPHGLRKQSSSPDHLGLGGSVKATCFPPACSLASSWDIALLQEIGVALGQKAADEEVALLLGPGLNIKRHPLCGRNFEYFSEDPMLSGELAGAMVRGVQSQGVGACLKHFAVNNQEQGRMVTDVIVDERTLREIYLRGFERAVKNSDPWSVMSAYNRVNGEYCSDSSFLLNTVLREDWGFSGLVVTDWGATNDRVMGLAGGLDLEMPGSGGTNNERITRAVNEGTLQEAQLDEAAARVTALALHGARTKALLTETAPQLSEDAHHRLARRAASESIVLLKNESVLPWSSAETDVAIIGEFAVKPRYQGAGSSQVNPTQIDSAFDAINALLGGHCEYAPGYDRRAGTHETDAPLDEALLQEAEALAARSAKVVLMIGLPSQYESEGFDRAHLNLPLQHNELVRRVCAANPNTVVVLSNGAPVLMPWLDQAPALLECYLGGQAGGTALADVLFGQVNPCGKLAESFPLAQNDVAADADFPGQPRQVQYREGLYVGYRYFDSAQADVLFPFGFGLSYTTFDYSNLRLAKTQVQADESVLVTVCITNTGQRGGKEIVQLYSSDRHALVHRPEHELRAFHKLYLEPGESRDISFAIAAQDFAYYSTLDRAWRLETGVVQLRVGSASRDVRLAVDVELVGEEEIDQDSEMVSACYHQPSHPFESDNMSFAALLGRSIPAAEPVRPFHLNSTLGEIGDTYVGKKLVAKARESFGGGKENISESAQLMLDATIAHLPLRAMMLFSGGRLSRSRLNSLIALMNKRPIKALRYHFGWLED